MRAVAVITDRQLQQGGQAIIKRRIAWVLIARRLALLGSRPKPHAELVEASLAILHLGREPLNRFPVTVKKRPLHIDSTYRKYFQAVSKSDQVDGHSSGQQAVRGSIGSLVGRSSRMTNLQHTHRGTDRSDAGILCIGYCNASRIKKSTGSVNCMSVSVLKPDSSRSAVAIRVHAAQSAGDAGPSWPARTPRVPGPAVASTCRERMMY